MILLYKKDGQAYQVIPARQRNDTPYKAKKAETEAHLASLPKTTSKKDKQPYYDMLARCDQEIERWHARRIESAMNNYGGIFADYGIFQVPEQDIEKAMKARFIEYNGKLMTYHSAPYVTVDGPRVIISQGWIHGMTRLEGDDITDFSELGAFSEPLNFKLCSYKSGSKGEIELFLWTDEEIPEDTYLPGKIFLGTVCQGRILPDYTITMT